jgi:hypothetical protein
MHAEILSRWGGWDVRSAKQDSKRFLNQWLGKQTSRRESHNLYQLSSKVCRTSGRYVNAVNEAIDVQNARGSRENRIKGFQ